MGAINGNAPVLLPGGLGLRIGGVVVVDAVPKPSGDRLADFGPALRVVLSCRGPVGAMFAVEASTDLKHWAEVPTKVEETAPGDFHAAVMLPDAGIGFFRLRRIR